MKRSRFCPSCGVDIEDKQEFCLDCKPQESFEVKDLRFDICERCLRYNFRNKWIPSKNVEEATTNVVAESVKNKVKKIKIKIPNVTMAAGVNVDFKAVVETKEAEYEIPGRFLVTICPKCSKDKTCYFEGILQLRNPKPDVIAYIKKRLNEVQPDGIYATKISEVRGGMDYYISSRKFLRKIGKELKTRFKGEFNESPQLFSRNHQTSKDIYRINTLFRCE